MLAAVHVKVVGAMAVDKVLVLNNADFDKEKSIKSGKKPYSKLVDVLLIAFSICTLLVDMATDVVLVVEYSLKGYYLWAGLTLLLVAAPTLIVEAFSIRWHSLDGKIDKITWIAHALCLGVAHRYILALQTAANGTAQSLLHQQQDLCLLHLFNSFLEAAPQLVLQLYVTAKLGNIPPWTGLSLVASLFSLAWAIAGYTRAMRLCRPDKQPVSWAALVLQAVWRAGTLTARIVALGVLALTSPMWLAILLVLHWIAMTAWAIWQRTDFCETWWEERAYNAVVGVIYCFCFFNLQEGPSRRRATAFYVITAVENGLCVAAYAMWGGEAGDATHMNYVKLVVMAVSLATVLGLSSMLVYYAFFHPAGVILPCIPAIDDCEARQNLSGSSLGAGSNMGRNTLRSLRHEHAGTEGGSRAVTPQRPPSSIANSTTVSDDSPNTSKQLNSSSAAVSAQESPSSTTTEAQLKRRPVCDISLSDIEDEVDPEVENTADTAPTQLKRRPLCKNDLLQGCESQESSPKTEEQLKRRPVYDIDLTEIELPKPEDKEQEDWEGDEVATVVASEDKGLGDETDVTSTCMSTHDYENICAVNITREPWGLRHWDGYSSDIAEHDSSVAGGVDGTRDRRRDTLVSTSTSYYSSSSSSSGDKLACTQPRCSEYLDSLAEDLKIAESEDNYTYIAQPYVIDHSGVCYPLDTIIEEEGSYETSSEDATIIVPNQKPSKLTNSCSSLVATIEEIRLSASLCNLYSPDEGLETVLDTTLEYENSENLDQDWDLEIGAAAKDLDDDSMLVTESNDINWQNISNKPLSQVEIDFLAQLKTSDVKETPPKKLRRKFSLLRERFEVGCAQKGNANSEDNLLANQRPEVSSVTSRIQQWNSLLRGRSGASRSPAKSPVATSSLTASGSNVVTLFPVAS